MGEPVVSCVICGRMPSPQEAKTVTLTWSRAIERGRAVWTCDRCSRTHLRSIEGKLDSKWW
ncbi:MAG: hypothetical protein WAR57_06995 [Candidatus Phosphoribacter sp.]|nr:hypothetical protein [Actinomycetales bacterium]